MKAIIDPKSRNCLMLSVPARQGTVRAFRMVGSDRNPGKGRSRYLHIEADYNGRTVLVHASGEQLFKALSEMLKP